LVLNIMQYETGYTRYLKYANTTITLSFFSNITE